MPVVIDSSIAGYSANSYITVAECDDYWENHYSAVKVAQWQALAAAQKVMALISACRVIETARFVTPCVSHSADYSYEVRRGLVVQRPEAGVAIRSDYYQKLQFPRNLDQDASTGEYYIPDAVKWAQSEQAVFLLSYDESNMADRLQGLQSSSVKAGDIAVQQTLDTNTSMFSPVALEFLKPFLNRGRVGLRRG